MTSSSNEEESIEQRTVKCYEDDDEENNSSEDGDEADDYNDDEEEGDGEEETNNGETASDTENDEVNPWDKLREEAINDLNSAWEEEVQENLHQGLQKDDAEIQASHRLLPVYRKKLRHLYLQHLRWYHDLKTDPVHKKVMKTLRSFMEEMDYTEAVEAAISKRKYLLNSLLDLEHFPTEDPASTEDDDVIYEPMERNC
ncbi:nonsense-mediated mRNA decay protein 2-like [Acropora millepora]|uniref:nonsense-mediated mRNA decay protein 2-like n=1 Tax=Acropora millepora TaxID=45264 RepID=UPI001CF2BCE8|nr:nonsense-mediated mRNA decay protein 2-like [Acropora millepora]